MARPWGSRSCRRSTPLERPWDRVGRAKSPGNPRRRIIDRGTRLAGASGAGSGAATNLSNTAMGNGTAIHSTASTDQRAVRAWSSCATPVKGSGSGPAVRETVIGDLRTLAPADTAAKDFPRRSCSGDARTDVATRDILRMAHCIAITSQGTPDARRRMLAIMFRRPAPDRMRRSLRLSLDLTVFRAALERVAARSATQSPSRRGRLRRGGATSAGGRRLPPGRNGAIRLTRPWSRVSD
jgi:hypothetical protein